MNEVLIYKCSDKQDQSERKVLDIKLHCEFEKQNNNMWLSLRVITFQFMISIYEI